ncbi:MULTISPECIES: prealbumin-like fold domain-containing protein [Corynebacterium]|uniref:prealbumin-like fold domain-containing protein n=1 Tax=Corynebacterium TaxID=1716 RepID=UPI002580EC5B|nr:MULTISPECIES: prealbumin-like fold domain-containing protein [Corynebacterium]
MTAIPVQAGAVETDATETTADLDSQADFTAEDGVDSDVEEDAPAPDGELSEEPQETEAQDSGQFAQALRALTASSTSLSCTPGTFYSLTSTGAVFQIEGNSGYTPSNTGIDFGDANSYNGLAIGQDGEVAYAFDRTNNNVLVKRWDSSGSVSEVGQINVSSQGVSPDSLIAGGMQPKDASKYYFGGYKAVREWVGGRWGYWKYDVTFELYRYDADTNSTDYLGSVPMQGLTQTGNGDLAFDAQGNMYILYNQGQGARLATVTAGDLAIAESNPGLTIRPQDSQDLDLTLGGTPSLNGVAFNDQGYVYVENASGNTAYFNLIDPSDGSSKDNGSAVLGAQGVDLASCASFPTIELKKNIDGDRAKPDDQFTLEIYKDGVTDSIAFGTTEGGETGIQDRQAGPSPAQPGATYRLIEKGVGGAKLEDYETSFTCEEDNGIQKVNDYEYRVTVPNNSSPVSCIYKNKAKPVAVARIEKGPRPGEAVTVDSEGKATLEYTVTVTNDDSKNLDVKTGSIKDDVRIPANVSVTGDGTVEFEADSGVDPTGVVSTIPAGSFVAGQQVELASDLLLPPGKKATFKVKVPIQVSADSTPAQWQELGECEATDGNSTGGVKNGVLMEHDSDGPENNVACIPVKKIDPTKITVIKEDSKGVALDGAQFALYKAELDGSGKPVGPGEQVQDVLPLVDGSTTSFTTNDLLAGYYYIVETKAPQGYSLLPKPIGFQLTWDSDAKAYNLELVDPSEHTAAVDAKNLVLKVADTPGGMLPESGGQGYLPFVGLGLIILIIGAFVARRSFN